MARIAENAEIAITKPVFVLSYQSLPPGRPAHPNDSTTIYISADMNKIVVWRDIAVLDTISQLLQWLEKPKIRLLQLMIIK